MPCFQKFAKHRSAWRKSLIAPLFVYADWSAAETLNADMFEYDAGPLSYFNRTAAPENFFSAWSPRHAPEILKPGLKIVFWGRGDLCKTGAEGGPVTKQGNPYIQNALRLTGIPLNDGHENWHWSPSGDTPLCDVTKRHMAGPSFVHLNDEHGSGGIGLFTHTGAPAAASQSFFRQYDQNGQSGGGANKFISGTFVTFRFDWTAGKGVFPWRGRAVNPDDALAKIRTGQQVSVYNLGDPLSPANKTDVIQAKQQMVVSFINRRCMQERPSRLSLCQLQYLFNTAVYRTNTPNWDNVRWFQTANLFFDPAQGGIPVFSGPLKPAGISTRSQFANTQDLWTSIGEPTQHAIFDEKSFGATISFKQLKTALALVSAKAKNVGFNEIRPADIENSFGYAWNDPTEWMLLSISIAQEVYNPTADIEAFIGGGIKYIYIEKK